MALREVWPTSRIMCASKALHRSPTGCRIALPCFLPLPESMQYHEGNLLLSEALQRLICMARLFVVMLWASSPLFPWLLGLVEIPPQLPTQRSNGCPYAVS
eukprot:scaffold35882_cov64-Attheya_sp.AAC.3